MEPWDSTKAEGQLLLPGHWWWNDWVRQNIPCHPWWEALQWTYTFSRIKMAAFWGRHPLSKYKTDNRGKLMKPFETTGNHRLGMHNKNGWTKQWIPLRTDRQNVAWKHWTRIWIHTRLVLFRLWLQIFSTWKFQMDFSELDYYSRLSSVPTRNRGKPTRL